MKTPYIIAGYFVVAVVFFILGWFVARVPQPERENVPTETPSAKVETTQAKSTRFVIDDLRVGGAPAKPPVETFPIAPTSSESVAIPDGTPPADDPSPSKGPKDALVIVLEISDFQCPVCKRAYEPLKQLADDFPGKVRLVFKHNPLAMHRNAMNAAAAAMAAARQGKFDAMADMLFANQSALAEEDLNRYAGQIGLDMNRFLKDYRDVRLRARAKAEGAAATALGATGTPSFFINGRKQVGWASYEAIKQEVSNEIRAVEGLMAQGKSIKEARIERVRQNLPEAEKFLSSLLGVEFREP